MSKVLIGLLYSLFIGSYFHALAFAQSPYLLTDVGKAPSKIEINRSHEKFYELNGKKFFIANESNYGSAIWQIHDDKSITFFKDLSEGGTRIVLVEEIFTLTNGKVLLANIASTDEDEVSTGFSGVPRLIRLSDNPDEIGELTVSGKTLDAFKYYSIIQDNGMLFGTTNIHDLAPDVIVRTDGSVQGTVAVAAVENAYGTRYLATVNGKILFRFDIDEYGTELGVSDGTIASSVLLKDIIPGSESSDPKTIGVIGETLYFSAKNASGGLEIWKTDGTEEGTTLIKEVVGPNEYGYIDARRQDIWVNNNFLFFTFYNRQTGSELWRIDGATDDIRMLKDIIPGSNSGIYSYDLIDENRVVIGTNTLFVASMGSDSRAIYVTDGTEQGTHNVFDSSANIINTTTPVLFKNKAYFIAENSAKEKFLYQSDGTISGTIKLFPCSAGRIYSLLDKLFFASQSISADTIELSVSDGTEANTKQLISVPTSSTSLYSFKSYKIDNKVYFEVDRKIYETSGTPESTVLSIDGLSPLGGNISGSTAEFAESRGSVIAQLVVSASDDKTYDIQLWKTKGTESSTVLMRGNFSATLYSSPDRPYFSQGRSFYTSNDTLSSIIPISDALYKDAPGIGVASNNLFFEDSLNQVWGSQGSYDSTKIIAKGSLYEPYFYDGNFNDKAFLALKNVALFGLTDSQSSQTELWVSDGTPNGTYQLADLVPGEDSSFPRPAKGVVVNDIAYFLADGKDLRNVLYRTDGSKNGTFLLTSFGENERFFSFSSGGSSLYFFTEKNYSNARLWKSDGTIAGTKSLFDLPCSAPNFSIALADKLIFSCESNLGEELWVSGGTLESTRLLKDIYSGSASSRPAQLSFAYGKVYFTANDGVHGRELWVTDGTVEGTKMVADFFKGPHGSFNFFKPYGVDDRKLIYKTNGRLIFAPLTQEIGRELWAIDVNGSISPTPTPTPSPTPAPSTNISSIKLQKPKLTQKRKIVTASVSTVQGTGFSYVFSYYVAPKVKPKKPIKPKLKRSSLPKVSLGKFKLKEKVIVYCYLESRGSSTVKTSPKSPVSSIVIK